MTEQSSTLERRETHSLIGSDKVEGTPLYRSNGDRLGTVKRIMTDKLSGKVAYAIMSFGGFLERPQLVIRLFSSMNSVASQKFIRTPKFRARVFNHFAV
jgi:PRC-barrel domain